MKLSQLLSAAPGLPIGPLPSRDPDLVDLTNDSRKVRAGSLFVAVRGLNHDGHDYVEAACKAGAAAVVVQRSATLPAGVAGVRVEDSAAWLAQAAAAWFGLDRAAADRSRPVVGVTGTNGKTTTAFLVQAMLNHAGRPTALIGTVYYDLIGRRIAAPMTTPPPMELAGAVSEACRHGARAVVMEVSSHSLAQKRADGIPFQVGVFTNLTGDHLDYHGTMEAYFAAKKRLFDLLPETGTAVVHADDPRADAIVADCTARLIRFGLGPRAELRAERLELSAAGSAADLSFRDQRCRLSTPLIGRHNILNALAAAGVGLALGLELDKACQGIARLENVRGRLQRVDAGRLGFAVVVDYAHTDDALENVLTALRPLTRGALWCVFGCGGDRDRTKRPRMAQVVERCADRIVVTSDNPRGETPGDIIADIRTGFSPEGLKRCDVEPDRALAILRAVERASVGDTVLIAGKGHEDYQIIGTQRLHFDDVEVAAEALRRRNVRSADGA
jgi:UDP-N-acetylmuramoyl-L-alanyl-D-glutamate--2,6-diaminopimelate ligase